MPQPTAHAVLAQEFAGYVIESTDITANTATGGGTTEITQTSVTFTAFQNVRYKVTFRGASESTVAADQITSRIRWQNSASPSISGAEIAKCTTYADTINHTFANVVLIGTFNTQLAGSVTITATIARAGGTGNVKMNGTVVPLYFLVEII